MALASIHTSKDCPLVPPPDGLWADMADNGLGRMFRGGTWITDFFVAGADWPHSRPNAAIEMLRSIGARVCREHKLLDGIHVDVSNGPLAGRFHGTPIAPDVTVCITVNGANVCELYAANRTDARRILEWLDVAEDIQPRALFGQRSPTGAILPTGAPLY
jgi:hypothetical protein